MLLFATLCSLNTQYGALLLLLSELLLGTYSATVEGFHVVISCDLYDDTCKAELAHCGFSYRLSILLHGAIRCC